MFEQLDIEKKKNYDNKYIKYCLPIITISSCITTVVFVIALFEAKPALISVADTVTNAGDKLDVIFDDLNMQDLNYLLRDLVNLVGKLCQQINCEDEQLDT